MLLVSALPIEMAPLLSALNAQPVEKYSKKTGLYRTDYIDLLVTGVGPIMAKRSLLRYLEQHHPDRILNFGTAGILDDHLPVKAVYSISDCYQVKTNEYETLATGKILLTAICASAAYPVISIKEKHQIFQQTGAQLVDMECFTLAHIAAQAGIKMSAIKVTTDNADKETIDIFTKHVQLSVQLLCDTVLNEIKL